MKEVIRIEGEKSTEEKPVEFTHEFNESKGWHKEFVTQPNDFDKVVYLGKCDLDGDMFAVYQGGVIGIFKGYINSGKY